MVESSVPLDSKFCCSWGSLGRKVLGRTGQKDAGEVVDHARLFIRSSLPSTHSPRGRSEG